MTIKVMGIDPGFSKGAMSIVEVGRASTKFLEVRGFKTEKNHLTKRKADDTTLRVKSLVEQITDCVDEFRPEVLAIEIQASGWSGKGRKGSGFQTSVIANIGRVRGAIDAISALRMIEIVEHSPSHVKSVVTKNGSATKLEVFEAVIAAHPETRRFFPRGRNGVDYAGIKELEHYADACAIALSVIDDPYVRELIHWSERPPFKIESIAHTFRDLGESSES